jgi:GNAT superfamily N-acetyltransferase
MERITLKFRDFESSDRAAAIELLSQGRPARYRAIKEAIFDWQFGANPHGNGSSPFLVGTVNGEVAALNGFMPVKIRYGGQPMTACWSCDTYVSSKFRGHGLGTQLISRVSQHAPLMLGFGISDMSDPIFAKAAWSLNSDNRMLFFHACESGPKGIIQNLRSTFARFPHVYRTNRTPLAVTRHDEDFGDEVDELWRRSAPGYGNTIERDAAYLNWKYRKHPLNRYRWYAVRMDGQLRGLLVARHSRTTSALVDYSGPTDDIDLMRALVSIAVADLIALATVRVQCETTHPMLLLALGQCGFVRSRYRSRFRVRSNLPGEGNAKREWFLMSGDSDGDMLGTTPLAAG